MKICLKLPAEINSRMNTRYPSEGLNKNVPHKYDCGGGPGMSSSGCLTTICFRARHSTHKNIHKREAWTVRYTEDIRSSMDSSGTRHLLYHILQNLQCDSGVLHFRLHWAASAREPADVPVLTDMDSGTSMTAFQLALPHK